MDTPVRDLTNVIQVAHQTAIVLTQLMDVHLAVGRFTFLEYCI